jgi:phenylalanyl-tRNA synthetase alpha chain
MESEINKLLKECTDEINACETSEQVFDVRVKFLGKNGLLTNILKGMKDLPDAERPKAGALVNAVKQQLEESIGQALKRLAAFELEKKIESEKLDVTVPPKALSLGSLHPITKVRNEIIEIFGGLGFSLHNGPEIETDYYCFEALNMPKDHPARDMQDTFYITEDIVLRTHTSPAQIRTMQSARPPIRMLSAGRVFRSDDDATHSPMFYQIEGLCVDKSVTLCDLKGILDRFAKLFFGQETKTRIRPSFFPFTEPSIELDASCSACKGAGCKLCKGTGWIEMFGAGMVNPKVLKNCGIDPKEYGGFAFGLGIDRLAMIKYGIPDLRLLYENDLRFLKQF